MSIERFKLRAVVYMILQNEQGKYFFLRRQNTGYMDGKLNLPSGYLERGETLVDGARREARQEAGVDIAAEDVRYLMTLHRYQDSGEYDYIDVFFMTSSWVGEAHSAEHELVSETVWATLDEVKNELVPYISEALGQIEDNQMFFEMPRGENE